jgi:hypothetical protein
VGTTDYVYDGYPQPVEVNGRNGGDMQVVLFQRHGVWEIEGQQGGWPALDRNGNPPWTWYGHKPERSEVYGDGGDGATGALNRLVRYRRVEKPWPNEGFGQTAVSRPS